MFVCGASLHACGAEKAAAAAPEEPLGLSKAATQDACSTVT